MRESKLNFHSVGRTHVGKVRSLNEDSLVERGDLKVWAVSDGMGGHTAGDVASGLIKNALQTLAPPASGESLGDRLRETLARANDQLFPRVTNGVTAVCKDSELAEMISAKDLGQAADEIVQRCLERGAPDNLSLVLIRATAD